MVSHIRHDYLDLNLGSFGLTVRRSLAISIILSQSIPDHVLYCKGGISDLQSEGAGSSPAGTNNFLNNEYTRTNYSLCSKGCDGLTVRRSLMTLDPFT